MVAAVYLHRYRGYVSELNFTNLQRVCILFFGSGKYYTLVWTCSCFSWCLSAHRLRSELDIYYSATQLSLPDLKMLPYYMSVQFQFG